MHVFVLMPFAPEFDDVFEHVIRAPLSAEGCSVSRADEDRGSRNIMHDVLQGISTADLVIVDLTGTNPNVYYELGVAHALGKKTVLLTQDLEEVPFDLRAYRVITYSTHFARVAEAIDALRASARGARDGTLSFGSPVSDFAAAHPQNASQVEIAVISPPPKAPEPQLPGVDDDYGPLDVMADVQEGMNALTEVATEMGARFERLNPIVVATQEKLTGPAKHEPIQARAAVRELAAAMDDYSRWLRPANTRFRQGLAKLTSGLDALFLLDVTKSDEAAQGLRVLLDVLGTLEGSVSGAQRMVVGLVEVVSSLPRIEKEFNRAKRLFVDEMSEIGNSLQQTGAVLARAREAESRVRNAG
jgi:hypothetical protein